MKFSLFFFAADASSREPEKYRLLIEAARLADELGLTAIWTPERHFDAFGGLYPNPAVTSAALAMVTSRLRLRAGSVIVPLHEPLRVAEEWAVVDNLSNGRVELSFGSGWNVNDFVLAPTNYEDRRAQMYRGIDEVRRLWSGEPVRRQNGAALERDIRTLPRPIQDEVPIWLTCQSHPTFVEAGERGFSVLTNLNFNPLRVLAAKFDAYREAWTGPGRGRIALMVHTYVAGSDDEAHAIAGPALHTYLHRNLDLRAQFHSGKQESTDDADDLTDDDREELVSSGIDRLFAADGLLGTIDTCRRRLEAFAATGVDELACLIDFGVDFDATLRSVERLAELAVACAERQPPP